MMIAIRLVHLLRGVIQSFLTRKGLVLLVDSIVFSQHVCARETQTARVGNRSFLVLRFILFLAREIVWPKKLVSWRPVGLTGESPIVDRIELPQVSFGPHGVQELGWLEVLLHDSDVLIVKRTLTGEREFCLSGCVTTEAQVSSLLVFTAEGLLKSADKVGLRPKWVLKELSKLIVQGSIAIGCIIMRIIIF